MNVPYGHKINSRYRGPAESEKLKAFAKNLRVNIDALDKIYTDLQTSMNGVIDTVYGPTNTDIFNQKDNIQVGDLNE